MTYRFGSLALAMALAITCVTANADDHKDKRKPTIYAQSEQPMTALADVLETMTKKTGHRYSAAINVPAKITLGGLALKDLDYATFLGVLENNRLAAVKGSDITRIVPSARIRQEAVPLITADATGIEDSAWVTMVIQLPDGKSSRVIPMLRPLMPAEAHLAAFNDDGAILIMDRYANVKRIQGVINVVAKQATVAPD